MHTGTVLIFFTLLVLVVSLGFQMKSAAGGAFARSTARKLYYLASITVFFSMLLLLQALLSGDFSLSYVYQNTSRDLPTLYKISALWAGQEGSYLLWLAILSVIGIVIIQSNDDSEPVIMTVITLAQVFILLLMISKNPFASIWQTFPESFPSRALPPGFDGAGLNPLLQDPWMAVHPPALFIGYAAATVPFAYAIAAMLKNDYSLMTGRAARWTSVTVLSLGVGIILGAYWAYRVLGWGGYWGWDEVENASLVPWLLSIALLHGLIVQKRTGALVKTNVALAMLTFIAVMYSAFLTRSGILANFSVHSFSSGSVSYEIAWYLLFFAVAGFALFFAKARGIGAERIGGGVLSTPALLMYAVLLITVYAALIALGTSMPIITKLFMANAARVTERYYNMVSVPFSLLLSALLSMAIIARSGLKARWSVIGAIAAAALVAAVAFNAGHTTAVKAYAISFAAFFTAIVIAADMVMSRGASLRAAQITHLGVAVLIAGIVFSGMHTITQQMTLEAGRETDAGGLLVTFRGITDEPKSSLVFTTVRQRREVDFRVPYYLNERMNSIYKEPYIISGLMRDVYLSPVVFESGLHRTAYLSLKKGEQKELGGISFTFHGFERPDMKMMMAGKAAITADIEVLEGEARYRIKPILSMDRKGEVTGNEVPLKVSGRSASLKELNRETESVTLFVEPAPGDALPPDTVLLDISIKRLIILVWAGTLLITVGAFLSVRKQLRA